jgi:hypothetical protein
MSPADSVYLKSGEKFLVKFIGMNENILSFFSSLGKAGRGSHGNAKKGDT